MPPSPFLFVGEGKLLGGFFVGFFVCLLVFFFLFSLGLFL